MFTAGEKPCLTLGLKYPQTLFTYVTLKTHIYSSCQDYNHVSSGSYKMMEAYLEGAGIYSHTSRGRPYC